MAPIAELPILGPIIARLGWRYFEKICWAPMADAAKKARASHGLRPQTGANAWVDLRSRRTPYLHCFSPQVLPRPTDWPAFAEVTGWCSLDAPSSWTPSPEIERFLAGGDAIYVGFGSMTGMDQEVLARTTLAAIRRAKKRAVICSGWGSLRIGGEDVLIVDDAPHDWLFERVAAVVHHGGAGTFGAGLLAGKPTLVVPFFGDQTLWGNRARWLGVGPAPVAKRKLDEARLAAAITDLCANPAYARRARELAPGLRGEHGAEKTAARILEIVS
jgi:sterol 3beta-glucosyltransferase